MTAESHGPALPAGLRERVLAVTREIRSPGQAVPLVEPDSPEQAFRHAADSFHRTLTALPGSAWLLPVLRDLDVQGLVGHLTGVEEDVQRCLAGDASVAGADHVASTQPAALRQAGRPAADTAAEWRAAADRTLDLLAAADLAGARTLYGVPLPLRDLLVARTFELWTHENDIRAAAGLPPSVPAPATLRPMAELATALLPFGAAVTGLSEPVSLHLVLTGPGGGTWDVAMGGGSGAAAPLGIVADVVGFCRLFANRISPADLDVYVTGDAGQAASVLAAAASLALD